MLLSDFSGLAQLGLFSIAGLIVAFAVTRLVLPHLSPAGYRAQPLAALGPSLLRLVAGCAEIALPADRRSWCCVRYGWRCVAAACGMTGSRA